MLATSSKAIADLANRLHGAATLGEVGEAVLAVVRSEIGPSGAHVCPLYPGTSPILHSALFSDHHPHDFMTRRALEEWPRTEQELAPLASYFGAPGDIFDFNARFGPQGLEDTRIFNDYWRECRIERQLMAMLGCARHPLGFICVARSLRERAFSSEEVGILRKIRELAETAFSRLSRAPNALSPLIGILSALSPSVPQYLALLDACGRVIWMSETAIRDLQATQWMAGHAPVFVADHPRIAAWGEAVRRLVAAETAHPSCPLTVHPIRTYEGPTVFLVAEAIRRAGLAASSWHALSRREREIAELAAEGYTATNVAARVGITVGTVRNHLKSVYRKLGIGSRVELVIRLGSDRSRRDVVRDGTRS